MPGGRRWTEAAAATGECLTAVLGPLSRGHIVDLTGLMVHNKRGNNRPGITYINN